MHIFHITSKANAERIAVEGFKPLIGKNSDSFGEPQPATYFFPSLAYAEEGLSNWMCDLFDEDEEICLIKVDASGLELYTVVDFEVFSLKPIESSRIVSIENL